MHSRKRGQQVLFLKMGKRACVPQRQYSGWTMPSSSAPLNNSMQVANIYCQACYHGLSILISFALENNLKEMDIFVGHIFSR